MHSECRDLGKRYILAQKTGSGSDPCVIPTAFNAVEKIVYPIFLTSITGAGVWTALHRLLKIDNIACFGGQL